MASILKVYFTTAFLVLLSLAGCKTPQKTGKSKEPQRIYPASPYRDSPSLQWNLVHTKLEIKPDFEHAQINGKAYLWLSVKGKVQQHLILDAQNMLIDTVVLNGNSPFSIKYLYDNKNLKINFSNPLSDGEQVQLAITYRTQLKDRITDGDGFYFINADSKCESKPTQMWTQGQTQYNSKWFPTIDAPNQRTTQEIYITIDSAYTSLSNGLLLNTTYHNDGTKTDYWKQSLPHAPYLTAIVIGKFNCIADRWQHIGLKYCVAPDYASTAQLTFGKTPTMMSFFSNLFGFSFPWEHYTQVVVNDYLSGAMENTGCVIYMQAMLQTASEYADDNFEEYVVHELAHQWFGDCVGTESWANISINEGFATYAEYLWQAYAYGRDTADHVLQKQMASSLRAVAAHDRPVVDFHYNNAEDLFDGISYEKGAHILHMLRSYLTDEIFFKAIKILFERHSFSPIEVTHWRLACEAASGEDLNWFFNQWYYDKGRPYVKINYQFNEDTTAVKLMMQQKQDLAKNPMYTLPVRIDFYLANGEVLTREVVLAHLADTFNFSFEKPVLLVNVDADKALYWLKEDLKPAAMWHRQYYLAPLFKDRYEVIKYVKTLGKPNSIEHHWLVEILNDRNPSLREEALRAIDKASASCQAKARSKIMTMVLQDSDPGVRLTALQSLHQSALLSDELLQQMLKDSSRMVVATAILYDAESDPTRMESLVASWEHDPHPSVVYAVAQLKATLAQEKDTLWFKKKMISSKEIYLDEIASAYQSYAINLNNFKILQEAAMVSLGLYTNTTRPAQRVVIATLIDGVLKKMKMQTAEEWHVSEQELEQVIGQLQSAIQKINAGL